MKGLPLEVIANITSYLPERHGKDVLLVRPSIATISRVWQSAVERDIFFQLTIDNTELDTFASVFSTRQARRRSLLKHLSYTIILPAYTDQECGVYETDEDRTANNKIVAKALEALFNVLKSWEYDPNVGFSLMLSMHSPMDVLYRDRDKLEKDRDNQALGRRQDVFEKRYEYSFVRLADADLNLLPPVSCITELSFTHGAGHRQLHPASQAALTLTKTRSLQKITCGYREPGPYVSLSQQIRQEFVRDLRKLQIGSSVRSFDLEIDAHFYLHHQSLPNLVFPHEHDCLSSELHRLVNSAQNLETVTYKGQVDASFFWPFAPGQEPAAADTRLWPSVKHISVHFNQRAPNGQWYVQARPPSPHPGGSSDEPHSDNSDSDSESAISAIDTNAGTDPLPPDAAAYRYPAPGYGTTTEETQASLAYAQSLARIPDPADGTFDSEREDFRTWPNEETLRPLLAAFVLGLEHMPAVLTAELTTEPASGGEWFVCYYAPGRKSGYADDDVEEAEGAAVSVSSPRVFFHMGDWRPSWDVVKLFKEFGKRKHGEECLVCFVPWMY